MTAVEQRLRQRIRADGRIPFAVFMEEALYGEGGYYTQGALPIGRSGDFVTGSSYSPLFGEATARILRRLDGVLGRPADFLEAGYGSGSHLRAVLADLGPKQTRRIWGWERQPRSLPAPARALSELAEIGKGLVEGLIFSYELFDALPVHRLIRRQEGLGELWVDLGEDDSFRFVEGELSDPGLSDLLAGGGTSLQPGQIADLAPGWRPLYRQLAECLGRGLLVTFDYGFENERLLDPRVRYLGTLACYRHQRVHRDPFIQVGEQDLTAHVDFSSLRAVGEQVGLETITLTPQARWLGASGIFEGLAEADPERRLEAMTLLDPEGMGEEIRVLVQGRGIEAGELFDLETLTG
jgi:SAM-dependent MidA family methyltransferase